MSWVFAGGGPGACNLAAEAKSPQEVADDKRDRDTEAYFDMLKTVAEEMEDEDGFGRPDGAKVHAEAMKRLKK